MDFIWFVIRPERAVAPADGAEAFEGGFAEGWEGNADGFAVACCTQVGLLWGRHCRYETAWSPMRWKVDALRCATRSVMGSPSVTKDSEESCAWKDGSVDEAKRQSFGDEEGEGRLLVQSSAANGTLIVSALRDYHVGFLVELAAPTRRWAGGAPKKHINHYQGHVSNSHASFESSVKGHLFNQ